MKIFVFVLTAILLSPVFLYAQDAAGFDRAMNLYRQRQYSSAIAEFQKVVEAEPNNAAAWYMLGYAHYTLDHHREAQDAFAKAFAADPSFDPRPYFRR